MKEWFRKLLKQVVFFLLMFTIYGGGLIITIFGICGVANFIYKLVTRS